MASPANVVILGGGFGGLNVARGLKEAPLRVTLIDRHNYHLFQPLLYQVAAAVLSPGDIASPIRGILRRQQNVRVLLAEVHGIDVATRQVRLDHGLVSYDILVLGTGATHAYFGHEEWRPWAPGLKTLDDALEIRRRVLLAFEQAELEEDPDRRAALLTFVVVGGGPTGVELAGALAGIARHALVSDFRSIEPSSARVLLIEGGPHVLASFPPDLQAAAERSLTDLGVDVRTSTMVTGLADGSVWAGPDRIHAATVLWAAGVAASPLGRELGAPVDKAGRVPVEPDLRVPGHPEIFVIGDLALAKDASGTPYPVLLPSRSSRDSRWQPISNACSRTSRPDHFATSIGATWRRSAGRGPWPSFAACISRG